MKRVRVYQLLRTQVRLNRILLANFPPCLKIGSVILSLYCPLATSFEISRQTSRTNQETNSLSYSSLF
jgi:hypothetical protein